MQSRGFRLPTPEVAVVVVDSSEMDEVINKVETNQDGEADLSHHQKRVVG